MASIAASRIASKFVRCSLCNYSVLNAFASACGAKLRQPETALRKLPSRMSRRGSLAVPSVARQFHLSQFILKETSHEEKSADDLDVSRQDGDEFDKLENKVDALADEVDKLSTSIHDIEYKSKAAAEEMDNELYESEEDASLEEDGEPWYLGQDAVPPPPAQFISPFIQPLPEVPPDSPPFMKDLFTHLTKDLGFSSLSVMDLRGISTATSLGGDLIVIICTARSPRHLHIGAEKAIRFMRSNFKFRAHADGLISKAEIRLKERRRRRKGKVLTAAEEEDNIVRWVCIDTGKGVLIQVMTKEKRDDLDLEGLLRNEIERSDSKLMKAEERVMRFLEVNRDRTLEDLQVKDLLRDEPPVRLRGYRSRALKRQNFAMYTRPQGSTSTQWGSNGGGVGARRYFHWQSWSQVTSSTVGNSSLTDPEYALRQGEEQLGQNLKQAIRDGDYGGIKEMIPKPWRPSHMLMILETHLNHLRLVTRQSTSLALEQLLSEHADDPWDSPFMRSFQEICEMDGGSPEMHHAMAMLLIHAHFIERLEYPSTDFSRNVYPHQIFAKIPAIIRQSGQTVFPETYYLVLRALATSPALRPGNLVNTTGSIELTDIRLTAMLPLMEAMRMDGYDVTNDVGVQSALFFATSPASTSVYMSELGDMNCPRGAKTLAGRTVVRQYDWRLKQFARTRLRNNTKVQDDPTIVHKHDALAPTVPTPLRQPRPTQNLPVLAMNPLANTSLANVPLPDATALVVYARAQDWDSFFSYYRSLLIHGFDIPPQMYSLIFQLVAKEGSPQHALRCLRQLWTDFQQDKQEVVFDHGIAAGLVGCFRELKNVQSGLLFEFRELKDNIGVYLRNNGMKLTDEYGITEFFDGEYFQKGMIHLENSFFGSIGPFTDGEDAGRGGGHFFADLSDLINDKRRTIDDDANDYDNADCPSFEGHLGGFTGSAADAQGVGLLKLPRSWRDDEVDEMIAHSEIPSGALLSNILWGTLEDVWFDTRHMKGRTMERRLKRYKRRILIREKIKELDEKLTLLADYNALFEPVVWQPRKKRSRGRGKGDTSIGFRSGQGTHRYGTGVQIGTPTGSLLDFALSRSV